MFQTDSSHQTPEPVSAAGRKAKPSAATIAVIIMVCVVLAMFMTPAGPYSFLIACGALIVLAVSSYLAGYWCRSRREEK